MTPMARTHRPVPNLVIALAAFARVSPDRCAEGKHHVDEIPRGVTHAALMSGGRISAQGPIEDVLTGDRLSDCFDTPLRLERRADGRFSAWGR